MLTKMKLNKLERQKQSQKKARSKRNAANADEKPCEHEGLEFDGTTLFCPVCKMLLTTSITEK